MFFNKKGIFLAGIGTSLCFAPIFFFPALFLISFLAYKVRASESLGESIKNSYIFYFGFYLGSLYWVSFGVLVYIEEFWWAIPFILFGLPAFLAIFGIITGYLAWYCRKSNLYVPLFAIIWVFVEWLSSFLFTGFPWALLGYSFAFYLPLIQIASYITVYGISFSAVYFGLSFTIPENSKRHLSFSIFILIAFIAFGNIRLRNNPTLYRDVSFSIVQPSLKQKNKWDNDLFWDNLLKQVQMSQNSNADIIIWPESALTVPHEFYQVKKMLLVVFAKKNQVLISGGISHKQGENDELTLYSTLFALDEDAEVLFEHYKSRLVPFGEYIPFKSILPIKKITHGLIDYSHGKKSLKSLEKYDLSIHPLICYEAIFPQDSYNSKANLFINITNDAWYGNSSGPYQHLQISRMRAVENGIPMLRAGNNGISAVIDSYGRILQKTTLNEVVVLNGKIPLSAQKIEINTFLICALNVLLVILANVFIISNNKTKKR